jgi:hypothetical protein
MGESVQAGSSRPLPTPHRQRGRHAAVRRAPGATTRRMWTAAVSVLAAAAFTATGVTAASGSTPVAVISAGGSTPVQTGACPAGAVPAGHMVAGHLVGESSCQVTQIDTVQDVAKHPWSEANVALSGTAAGYVEIQGAARADLADYPNRLFPQFGITQWEPATTTYSGSAPDAGNGLTVLWPQNKADWNGRVLVLAPGQENVPPIGALVPRQGKGLDNQTYTNLYAGPAIDEGYAVVYIRRQAESGLTATLDGGGTRDTSLNDNVATLVDWITTAETLLNHALGADPKTVLFYGHSSGNIVGNLLRESGANTLPGGRHVVDGVLADDQGGGLPLPLYLPEGQLLGFHNGQVSYPAGAKLTPPDVPQLTQSQAKQQLVPEITLAHTLYTSVHSWLVEANFLALKRATQLAYQRQGLTQENAFYEIAGNSHQANQVGSPPMTQDMEGVFLATLSDLQSWVERGTRPPANLTDLSGGNAQPPLGKAIDLPPVACPTGFRYGDPVNGGGPGTAGYAAYDAHTLEPITAGGELVDVNGDGVRDTMPSLDQAWQRLNLIGSHQRVTKAVFMACVHRAVDGAHGLVPQRLLDPEVGAAFVAQAARFPNISW